MPTPPDSAASPSALRKALETQSGSDVVLKTMLDAGNIPLTRENYIDLAYGGTPPDPWTVEHEMELPEPFQRSD
jgi:hypothetical protein